MIPRAAGASAGLELDLNRFDSAIRVPGRDLWVSMISDNAWQYEYVMPFGIVSGSSAVLQSINLPIYQSIYRFRLAFS